MIWCSLNLLFFSLASWRHTRLETSTFQWSCFYGYLQRVTLELMFGRKFLELIIGQNGQTLVSSRNKVISLINIQYDGG